VISNFFDNFFIDLQSRGFQRYGTSFALGVVSACVNYAVDALREKSACSARLRRQVNNIRTCGAVWLNAIPNLSVGTMLASPLASMMP
jgi:hypothetical protein